MSLRRKTILITSITLTGLILLLYLVLSTLIMGSYTALEQQMTLRNLNRAGNSFHDTVDRFQLALSDWSSWDDTYDFVQDGNAEYVESNLMDDTFWSLQVNLMMFVNTANEIIYAKMVDLSEAEQTRLLTAFEDAARSDNRFLRLTTSDVISGFVVIAGEPMIIASRPILRSDDTGPQAGTLIWARHVDQQALAAASVSLRTSIALFDASYLDLPGDVVSAQSLLSPGTPQITKQIDQNMIGGYALLNDIYGVPTLILRIAQEREIHHQGQATLTYFLAALLLVGVVLGVGGLIVLERLVLAPLSHLSERVRYIGVDNNFSARFPVEKSPDELTQFAAAINTMLDTVSHSRAALQELNEALERRVMERTTELEDQKSQLQTIMDAMGEGLVYCVDGMIQYVNGAFVDLIDHQVRDVIGKPFRSFTHQPDVEHTSRRYETVLMRPDGTAVNVAITSMSVDDFDEHQRCVIIVHDITQELKAKKQKEYFFARASHDLRSPLTSIMTRLYLLEKKPEELATHLRILNRTSDQMLQLVNDLLDVSRVEQGALILKRRDLVLQSVIDDVVEIQRANAEMRNIRLSVEMEDAPLNVNVDPLRVNQVVTNLVANAIHYTPEGGEIAVKVEPDDQDSVKYAVIRVTDNGIGISREDLDHIFDPFFRVDGNQEHGSGLGLYIVKEIVQLHGGEISVESEVGKGSTFSVYLALSDTHPVNGRMHASANDAPPSHSPASAEDKSPAR